MYNWRSDLGSATAGGRPQKGPLEQGEDVAVRGERESEGQDHSDGQAWCSPETTSSVAKILFPRVEHVGLLR